MKGLLEKSSDMFSHSASSSQMPIEYSVA